MNSASRTTRVLIAAAFVAVLASMAIMTGLRLGRSQPAPSSDGVVEPLSFNFGRAWAGSTVTHTFRVKNPDAAELTVDRVISTCSCTVVQPPRSIPAGGAVELPVSILLPNSGTEFQGTVSLLINGKPPIVMQVTGEVISRAPAMVDLGRFTRGERAKAVFRVNSRVPTRLEVTSASFSDDLIAVEYANPDDDPSAMEFHVVPTDKVPYGLFITNIDITTNDPEVSHVTIPIRGYARFPLEPVPRELSFGVVSPGQSVVRRMDLYAVYGGPVEAIKVSAMGDGSVVYARDLEEFADRKVIELQFTNNSSREVCTGTILISADVKGERVADREVRYYALARASNLVPPEEKGR